jgi:predicted nucleotidyltransferase component of viral defense system
MSPYLDRPATRDGIFLWIMHRFAEVFEEHAVIKGGMALRLLDCPRRTVDIDYVFVPFESKKEIVDRVSEVLDEIDGASVDMDLHSKMLRADLRVDGVAIQLEANVALQCETIPLTTGGFAHSVGQPSQVVRIMSPATALSHKLAAWNERRLLRDLYDCYFLAARAGTLPDRGVLDHRLSKIESRLPKLKGTRRMSRAQLSGALREEAGGLTDADLEEELAGLLPADELAGLAIRIRAAVSRLADAVESDHTR